MESVPDRSQHFRQATIQLLSSALGASRVAFYLVDDAGELHDFVVYGMPSSFLRQYVAEMHSVDPLHVRRVASPEDRVVRMAEADRFASGDEIGAYVRFLRRFDVVDNIELMVRDASRIRAGVSVMWTAHDGRPNTSHMRLADELQRYIEFNAPSHLVLPRTGIADRAMAAFRLTPRECEVAKLVCLGRTNADIAAVLGIGIATVKTHVIRIFEKTAVETRSALVARLSGFVA